MSDLKIFTENIEQKALSQIYELVKQPVFSACKVRIMPDVHAGAGCVIGFTADLGDKVIPNIVGVDIGCGMLTVELGKIDIDFQLLDEVIKKYIPSGKNVRSKEIDFLQINDLYCKKQLKNMEWLKCSIGTLGGGNHFIEVDEDSEGMKYLIIHTGSRNLGKQVAEIYQQIAIDDIIGNGSIEKEINNLIADYKKNRKEKEICKAIIELKNKYNVENPKVPKELCYLTGKKRDMYLHDMEICQTFALYNREWIASIILDNIGLEYSKSKSFQTIHNYIDHDSNIVRKGAISARNGERLLIPINMRDGCIIGVGKGNEDWNYSAPHGAGRIMSRLKAKEIINLNDFEDSMKGIYTTSVNRSTIDESPMAYKPMQEIIENIKDTVEIEKIIKPVYNFKASE